MELFNELGQFVERLLNSSIMHRALLGGSLIALVASPGERLSDAA